MLTLSLLRHAKAALGDAELDDSERPLAARGIEAAPRMGRFMAENGLIPDLVLCSGAVRTRQTLALLLPELARARPAVRYDDGLYLASRRAMAGRLLGVPDGTGHVLLVGHNPGIQALALGLIGTAAPADLKSLAAKFPTCGLAVLTFDAARWSDIRAASGTLIHFMSPRRLAD